MEQINLNCFYAFKFLWFLLLLLFIVNKQCLTSQAALSATTPRSSLWAPSCAQYLGYAKKTNANFLDRNLAIFH